MSAFGGKADVRGALFRTRKHVLLRNRVTGGLMIGAGVGLALVRRA